MSPTGDSAASRPEQRCDTPPDSGLSHLGSSLQQLLAPEPSHLGSSSSSTASPRADSAGPIEAAASVLAAVAAGHKDASAAEAAESTEAEEREAEASAAEAAEDADAVHALRLHAVASLEESSLVFPCCKKQHWLCQEIQRRHLCNVCSARGTLYRCERCDYDLCFVCYTRAKRLAQLGPTCNQLHLLKPDPQQRNLCDRCSKRGTAYRCPEGCDFDVCVSCYDEMELTLKVPLRGLGKHRAPSSSSLGDEDIENSTDVDSMTGSSVTSKTSMAKLWRDAWDQESKRSGSQRGPPSDSENDSEEEETESPAFGPGLGASFALGSAPYPDAALEEVLEAGSSESTPKAPSSPRPSSSRHLDEQESPTTQEDQQYSGAPQCPEQGLTGWMMS